MSMIFKIYQINVLETFCLNFVGDGLNEQIEKDFQKQEIKIVMSTIFRLLKYNSRNNTQNCYFSGNICSVCLYVIHMGKIFFQCLLC